MEKVLKNEQKNEETSQRIEQKFMNEVLSKTREIEENLLFRHENRLFQQSLRSIWRVSVGILTRQSQLNGYGSMIEPIERD